MSATSVHLHQQTLLLQLMSMAPAHLHQQPAGMSVLLESVQLFWQLKLLVPPWQGHLLAWGLVGVGPIQTVGSSSLQESLGRGLTAAPRR